MEKIIALLDELFLALEGISTPMELVELVIMAIMVHRLKSSKKPDETINASSDPVSPAPADTSPVATAKQKKAAKSEIKEQFAKDLELLFSDKSEEEMTDEENARCERLLNFIKERNSNA